MPHLRFQPTPPRRILVVCTQRIGDVLLATPLVRTLRQAWPDADLHMLVTQGTEGILENNPDLDEVIAVPAREPWRQGVVRLGRLWRRYDLALSPMASDRSRFFTWVAGRYRLGLVNPDPQDRRKAWLLHDSLEFDDRDTPTVTMGLRLAQRLGLPLQRRVVLPSPDAAALAALDVLVPRDGARPYAVLHPHPKFRYKMWTVDGWARLAREGVRRGYAVLLTGSADAADMDYCRQVATLAGPGVMVLAGRLSLAQTAALLHRAAFFAGPDTAVTHMAAASGIPTLALFGPSNPVKWGPWPATWDQDASPWPWRGGGVAGNVVLLQGEGDCVPCLGEGCDRHTGSISRCLTGLAPARVLDAVAGWGLPDLAKTVDPGADPPVHC